MKRLKQLFKDSFRELKDTRKMAMAAMFVAIAVILGFYRLQLTEFIRIGFEDVYKRQDPGRVRAKAYDIVLNGNEIGGGSIRIFNPEIQSKMFEVLGFTPEQAQEQFGFLLTAFKYGVPPHAGLAYGLSLIHI